MYPTNYKRYAAIARALGAKPQAKEARFAARYKFAGQLVSIEIAGNAEATSDSYLQALRLALAYSALESLEALVGRKGLAIKSIKLAAEARGSKLSKLKEFLKSESEPKMARRLEVFYESSSSDLRPVIEALRHSMFHGQFNPSATGISNASSRSFIEELCQATFKLMDSEAADYFAGRIQSLS
jgi:hypothetical protein